MRTLFILLLSSWAWGDTTVGGAPAGEPVLRALLTLQGSRAVVSELRLEDGERILWHRPPPQKVSFAHGAALDRSYKSDPRATLEALGHPFFAVRMRPDSIAVALHERLWIFDRADGHTLVDRSIGAMGFGGLAVEKAVVTVDGGCPSPVSGVRFLVGCGPILVYQSGVGLTVFRGTKLAGSYLFPDVTPPDKDGVWRFLVGGVKIAIQPAR